MPRINVSASTETPGAIDTVFALLKDSTTWPKWAPVGSCSMKSKGMADAHGIGAVRVFSTGLFSVTEEIVEVIPNRKVAYVLKSGLPLKNYRAAVDLTPMMNGGSVILWQASFEPAIPLSGWYFKMMVEGALKENVRRLSRTAANKKFAAQILESVRP